MNVLHDISLWLWRLLPANPILVRVVSQGGKRPRHHWVRVIYLLALFVVIFIAGSGSFGTVQQSSLAELAKKSTTTFMFVSLVQLFLMSFIAPVFTAGAITQEKDANTFHILLTTPLSNAQIVLGSLFSRLYFVWVLLLAGLPIFCITMLFGGVTATEVFQSFGLAACTGLVTGSLAIMIGIAKVGTQRTIFAFFLGVAAYLLTLGIYGISPYGWLAEAELGTGSNLQMSWIAPIHPFLALLVVTGQTPAPPISDVLKYGWPWSWLLAHPQYGYMVLTTLASIAMILISLFFVRRSAKEGEVTLLNRFTSVFKNDQPGVERGHKPRRVWNNPIAWREAATQASAAGRSTLRWTFVGIGILAGFALLIAHESSWWGLDPTKPALTRSMLTALTWIELVIVLLLVTNTAATTLTREKETQTMELLLSTPLTSKYIVAGMLRGLVSFVMPMIGVPAVTLLLFTLADFRHDASAKVTTPEAFVMVPLLMTAFASLAAMVGMQFSLVSKKTVQAVMISTAIVLGASGLAFGCGALVIESNSIVSAVILPFTPIHAIKALIDYGSLAADEWSNAPPTAATLMTTRLVRLVTSVVAVAAYAAVTFHLYNSMVRNFDMTIRRQSA